MKPALVALLLALPAAAQDFVRTTVKDHPELPLFWTTRCMVYRIGAAGSVTVPDREEDAAIDAAFATWQHAAAGCGNAWTFVRGSDVPVSDYRLGPLRGELATAQVLFRQVACDDAVPDEDPCREDPDTAHTKCANAYQCMWDDPSTIGLTTVTYLPKTGQIVDADIELNEAPWHTLGLPGKQFTASDTGVVYDVQNTMTHELGHALGFDHVGSPASTMFAHADVGEISKRVIDDGTLTGFCSVYGSEDTQQCVDVTKSGLSAPGPVSGGCAAAPLAPVLMLAALVLRRRRLR